MSGVEIGGALAALGGGLIHLFKAKDGRGNWRSVADATARDAIIPDCQELGMLVFQIDTLTMYRLTALGSPPTYAAVSLGGGAPSGTGWVKVISGAFSVVSSIVAADVSDFATAVTARIAATAPTGNGFARYVAGVRNAAAQLIDLANDINTSTILPIANQASQLGGAVVSNTVVAGYALIGSVTGSAAAWVAPPGGTGILHYTSGVPAANAALLDLANDVDPSTILGAAQGGGRVLFATQNTNTGTPVLLATSPVVPTGAAVSCFGHVLFDDNGTSAYDAVAQGVWRNNAGTLTGVYTPPPPNGNGSLLGCAISFVINNTTKKIEMYGTLSGTALGTTIYMVPELTSTAR